MSLEAKVSPKDDEVIDVIVNPDIDIIDEQQLQRQKSLKLKEQVELQLTEQTKINCDLISVSLQTQNYKIWMKPSLAKIFCCNFDKILEISHQYSMLLTLLAKILGLYI